MTARRKRIAILGSTGSIGSSALAVIAAHPDRLEVIGLAAGENTSLFAQQIERFRPRVVAMASATAMGALEGEMATARWRPEVAGVGEDGLSAVAAHPDVDVVLCASAGTAGLDAILAAIDAGRTIALANKEVLVMAGAIITERARQRGVAILPVDSEHNAIHQCLHGRRSDEVRRLILTASGGPFLGHSPHELERVGPEAALRHPTWQMGRKITIDSATLMNKGLEVIEARWLFGVAPERIDVLIHPQSIIHSMVELCDGSMIAQLGITDMRLPIQYAFSYPDRWEAPLPSLDLTRCGPLEFAVPDHSAFPCLQLAYRALTGAGSLPVVLNAANEVAVASFLEGRLSFTAIPQLIERTMEAHTPVEVDTLSKVRDVDRWARESARQFARGIELKV